MKKEDQVGIIFIIVVFLIGFFIGRYLTPEKPLVPVSERVTACEEKGGRYNLYHNSFGDYYYEVCRVFEDQIKDF